MSETSSPAANVDRTLREIAKFQFVLSEGRKGNHLLFDPDLIRTTFTHDASVLRVLFQEKLDEINAALNRTFQYESFEEKRDFLKTLPVDIQQALVFGYFQLLDEGAPESRDESLN